VHRLGDVGGVVADALDVLGAEQKVGAERDVARILHHVGQELAKERGVERIDGSIPLPHIDRLRGVLLRVGVEHVLELAEHQVAHVLKPEDDLLGLELLADGERPLGDVLRQVADALHVAGDADRRDRLAQVDRQRLAPRDGQDGALLHLALEHVEAAVGRDHGLRQGLVVANEGRDGIDEHLLGDAAHLGDAPPEPLQVVVVGSDDVLRHGKSPFWRFG
jgi:hypothetical protein